jgi:signal transduction histidine kinase
MKLDGTLFDTEVSLNRLPPPHEASLIAIVRDITERKRAEEDLRRLNERLVEEHRQRKLLSKRLIQLLETRNRKISMDLHDHIGQTLVTLKIDLDMISERIGKTGTSVTPLIEKAKHKTLQAIEDVEKIAYGLRPSMIDTLGLVPALRDLFKEIKQQRNIEIHFFTRDVPKRFDQEKEVAIFRVAQEALCNVIKHAQAKNCFVNLVKKGDSLTLSVEDDGRGFDEARGKRCASRSKVPLGLLFMQERVVQLNGEFTVESRAREGVHLLVELPL